MTDPLIEFVGAVQKVQTLVDGGLRVTIDLPETAVSEAAQLMECKRQGTPLTFRVSVFEATAKRES
jgi:hypothetical protein